METSPREQVSAGGGRKAGMEPGSRPRGMRGCGLGRSQPRGLLYGGGGASSSRWARLGDGLEEAKALWLLSVTLCARA